MIGAFGRTVRVIEPVPVRERVWARELLASAAHEAALRVDRLLAENPDPASAADALAHDPSLTPPQRRAAMHRLLRRGLASPQAR